VLAKLALQANDAAEQQRYDQAGDMNAGQFPKHRRHRYLGMRHRVTQSILDYNGDREPERLRRKFELLRADPFGFYRGTCHLYYETLPRHPVLSEGPALLVCGDLHLENFGVYKGDNRLAYFDLNDFDEADLAPFTIDLHRFVTSLHVAASALRLADRQAESLGEVFLDRYCGWIADGKARWLNGQPRTGWCAIYSGR
jgi:uncharacterized protein (DUF2252 family)